MTIRVWPALACAALGYGFIAGCASSPGAGEQQATLRLPRQAPTAREMESPLNGTHKTSAVESAEASADATGAPIEESITIETTRLHGYSFPGVGAPEAAPVGAPGSAQAPAAGDGQRVVTLERRLNELETQLQQGPEALEQRVREMEAKLAALEGREPRETGGAPQDLQRQFLELSQKLEDIEQQQATLATQDPDTLRAELQAMEARIAEIENRPPREISAAPEAMEEHYRALSAKLEELERQQAALAALDPAALRDQVEAMASRIALLEDQPAQQPAADPAGLEQQYLTMAQRLSELEAQQASATTLHEQMQAMEERLARVENRPAREIPESDAVEERFNELSARLAAIENQPAEAPSVEAHQTLRDHLQQMETRLAELEDRPPRVLQTRPENMEARFDELSGRLAALEGQTPDPAAAQERGTLKSQLQAMEARLAQLEHRPAQPVQVAPEEVETRFDQLSAKIAALETQAPDAPPVDYATLRDQIAMMETRLAQMEQRPAAPVAATDDSIEARFNALSEQLHALDQRSAQGLSPEIETRLRQTEERVASLEQAPRVVDTTPGHLEERIETMQAEMDTLRQQVSTQQAVEPLTPAYSSPALAYDGAVTGMMETEYRIGAGDQLEFTSFNDPTLSREEIVVRFDGFISLPQIPDIRVGGLTRQEAEAEIKAAYGRIFRNPLISLMIRSALSKSFTVVGDISAPGLYPYEQPIRLIDAISIAGGLRERSGSGGTGGGYIGITGQLVKGLIIRSVQGERQVFQYDLRSLGTPGQHGSEAPVLPGDVIYIPEGVNLVYVLGEAGNNVVELIEGMTLLQALSLSGGFQAATARLNQVVIMREVDPEHSEVMLVNMRRILGNPNLDVVLQPGDIIYVPRKRLVRIEEFIARFTGSISPIFGLYNDYIDAKYQRRINEQLLEEDSGVLQTITALGATSQSLIDVIGSTP